MGFTIAPNTDVMVLIMDMQDRMWHDPNGLPHINERLRVGMEEITPEIGVFADQMRALGAHIVHVHTDNPAYGDSLIPIRWGDEEISKLDYQSAHPENVDFFEEKKQQSAAYGRNLMVLAVGVFAGQCVRNTVVDLHKAGFDARVVGDLVMHERRPGRDEQYALHATVQQTGGDHGIITWKDEIVGAMIKAPGSAPGAPSPV